MTSLNKTAYPAVIMAGGSSSHAMHKATGTDRRALIPIRGRPMLSYVVDALKNTDYVKGIVVVGDVPPSGDYSSIQDQGGFVENVYAGLSGLAESADHVLYVSCDIPFLTPDAVSVFMEGAIALNADFVYPIVPVSLCYDKFPGIKRTSLKLRDNEYTGGNLVLVRPSFLIAQREVIQEVYTLRKSPVRLALKLGLTAALGVVVSKAFRRGLGTVEHYEAKASHWLGGNARALHMDYPELATDIDSPADFKAAS
jgi:GTP:adenosylcobinamide-phosphate guanylyltransferase